MQLDDPAKPRRGKKAAAPKKTPAAKKSAAKRPAPAKPAAGKPTRPARAAKATTGTRAATATATATATKASARAAASRSPRASKPAGEAGPERAARAPARRKTKAASAQLALDELLAANGAPAAAAPAPRAEPAAPAPSSPDDDRYSPPLRDLVALGRRVLGIRDLRLGQPQALEHLLAGDDVLAVMPTGSGKSLLYQLPSLILPGITVVVSPLIALIKDQVEKMKDKGVAVCRVDSTLTVKQKREMTALVNARGGKLLLTTPERMADPEFRAFLKNAAAGVGVSLFVVDEAHCVSQWGHDFRPSYLSIRKALEDLGMPQVLATTATAPPHVRDDILHQLGLPRPAEGGGTGRCEIVTTTFDRPNLHYEVIALPGDDDKNKTLVTLLKKLPRPGIVYCATVKKVEELHASLARHGIPIGKYHGRLTKNERDAEQVRFMTGKDVVMLATNAFGLGVDKRDIRYVLHYHVPGSLEAYAQEAGRGGRDGKPARCVLLFSPDDVLIQEYFLKGTYPTKRQVRAVWKTLEQWTGDAPSNLENLALGAHVGVARARTVLSLLKDEGFVVEQSDEVYALARPQPEERLLLEKARQYEARRIADRQRLDALLAYVSSAGCRSQVILGYLGEVAPARCGRCDNCMRSKDAALAAARQATMLEDGVISALREDDEEDEREGIAPPRRVRARLIRIDGPAGNGGGTALPAAAATAGPAAATTAGAATAGGGAALEGRPAPGASGELARLIAEQEADRRGRAAGAVPARAPAARGPARDAPRDPVDDGWSDVGAGAQVGDGGAEGAVAREALADGGDAGDAGADALEEGDADLDDDDADDDDADDADDDDLDDEDDADDEDDEDDEDVVDSIDKTAAALAEEGVDPGDNEITVLARKRQPKPPRKKPVDVAAPADPKKKRRRRRRKGAIPPASAFTTPVLVRAPSPAPTPQSPAPRGARPGPLVEYVRGPLRINMPPVASANPNDAGVRHKPGKKRRGFGGPGGPSRGPGGPGHPGGPRAPHGHGTPHGGAAVRGPYAPAAGDGQAGSPYPPGVAGAPGEPGQGKRRKRRRRRKRGGGNGAAAGAFDPNRPVDFFSQSGDPPLRPVGPPPPHPGVAGGAQGSAGAPVGALEGQPGSGRRRRRRRRR